MGSSALYHQYGDIWLEEELMKLILNGWMIGLLNFSTNIKAVLACIQGKTKHQHISHIGIPSKVAWKNP
jgi:hypothetical protein